MHATVVTTPGELEQVYRLSQKNLRANVAANLQSTQGFITWNYSPELLAKMNAQQPHIIVKDNNRVIGYALVALKQAAEFHPELKAMMQHLDTLVYRQKNLGAYNYYVMGQVCIEEGYRGKGVFKLLYDAHKKLFENNYDFVLTEISVSNARSMAAHTKQGFKTIHNYRDALDDWNVVLWNWK